MVCGEKTDKAIIELPNFPMTEIYTTEKIKEKVAFCNQSFHVCRKCGHGQISHVIDVSLQYGDSISYSFRTSKSATGRESSDFFINFLLKTIKSRRLGIVIEVGANDMYILRTLSGKADKLIGVDPILKGKEKEYSKGNIVAIGNFFEDVSLHEKFDVVICKDTLEHVEDPKQFAKKIVELGDDNTIYFFEMPFLETLLTGLRFDQIFHQHLNYFSLKSIIYMLRELDCELLDYQINYNLWGSILFAFKKGKNWQRFARNIRTFSPEEIIKRYALFKNSMDLTQKQLKLIEKENEKIYGYGAALMLPVLSYHLGNDFSSFVCIIDDDISKDNLYYINLPVTIKYSGKIHSLHDSTVLITAISTINNTRRIIAKLSDANPKQIIVPLNIF